MGGPPPGWQPPQAAQQPPPRPPAAAKSGAPRKPTKPVAKKAPKKGAPGAKKNLTWLWILLAVLVVGGGATAAILVLTGGDDGKAQPEAVAKADDKADKDKAPEKEGKAPADDEDDEEEGDDKKPAGDDEEEPAGDDEEPAGDDEEEPAGDDEEEPAGDDEEEGDDEEKPEPKAAAVAVPVPVPADDDSNLPAACKQLFACCEDVSKSMPAMAGQCGTMKKGLEQALAAGGGSIAETACRQGLQGLKQLPNAPASCTDATGGTAKAAAIEPPKPAEEPPKPAEEPPGAAGNVPAVCTQVVTCCEALGKKVPAMAGQCGTMRDGFEQALKMGGDVARAAVETGCKQALASLAQMPDAPSECTGGGAAADPAKAAAVEEPAKAAGAGGLPPECEKFLTCCDDMKDALPMMAGQCGQIRNGFEQAMKMGGDVGLNAAKTVCSQAIKGLAQVPNAPASCK